MRSLRISLIILATIGLATCSPLRTLPDDHFWHRHSASDRRADAVIQHWTPDRIANARPRDLLVNDHGAGRAAAPMTESTVVNGEWESNWGGTIQTAVGRIYFEFGRSGYVCSGTVARDSQADRSIIITAAHCAYDEQADVFATNVLFIPNQAGTTGSGTDTNCDNDPLGCWAPSYAVADTDWATRSWPNNIPWDYAFYIVPSSGAHAGPNNKPDGSALSDNLEEAAGSISVSFSPPPQVHTYGLGYSYAHDPNFMHCAEQLGAQSSSNFNAHWLGSCGLSGGSSGGPWIQGDAEQHTIVAVNSWGFSSSPGMGAPRLDGVNNGHAAAVFALAECSTEPTSGHGLLWEPALGEQDPCGGATDTPTPAPSTEPPTDTPTEPPTDTPTEPPTDTPTEPPTDTPTEPPTDEPASENCKPWCTRKSRSAWAWRRLCLKDACSGCGQCDSCMAFCNTPRPGWKKKCDWSECAGCGACNR